MHPITQGRRESNVGPRPAQIWRISGFVNCKTDEDSASVLSKLWCDLQQKKKGLYRNSNGFLGQNQVISYKEKKGLHRNFDGPWGHCTSLPPSRYLPAQNHENKKKLPLCLSSDYGLSLLE